MVSFVIDGGGQSVVFWLMALDAAHPVANLPPASWQQLLQQLRQCFHRAACGGTWVGAPTEEGALVVLGSVVAWQEHDPADLAASAWVEAQAVGQQRD